MDSHAWISVHSLIVYLKNQISRAPESCAAQIRAREMIFSCDTETAVYSFLENIHISLARDTPTQLRARDIVVFNKGPPQCFPGLRRLTRDSVIVVSLVIHVFPAHFFVKKIWKN